MPPNQFAHVMSRTPDIDLMVSAWLIGMLKIIDVDRIVMIRVAELAATALLKPSRIAVRAEKRNTAMATLSIVSAVRRLLRRAPLRMRATNFMPHLPARRAFLFRDA